MSNPETILSLESYAAVMAALGRGLALPRALAHADVDSAAWERGSAQWQEAIDESAASDLAVLVAFDAALLAAKRRFEPTVEPIESDARAWTHFRRHFVTAPDPVAFVAKHGLSLATYARLEADWANRALSDESLAAELQSHLLSPLEECPTLTLVPSRLLLAEGAGPPQEAPARPREAPLEDRAAPPAPPPPAPPAPPTPPPVLSLPAVREEADDEPTPIAYVPARPPVRLDRTLEPGALVVNVPPLGPLPFRSPGAPASPGAEQTKEPPEAAPIPLERYAVVIADMQVFGMTEAQICEKHQMTPAQMNQALRYWKGRVAADAALQGRVKATMDRYQAARARAGAVPSPPADAGAARAPAPDPLGQTADLTARVQQFRELTKGALPFTPGAPAKRPAPARTVALPAMDPTSTAPPRDPAARRDGETTGDIGADTQQQIRQLAERVLPFQKKAPQGPGLTLEQYAKVCTELWQDPTRTTEIRARYGIADEAAWMLVHGGWQEKIRHDPALYKRWMELTAAMRVGRPSR